MNSWLASASIIVSNSLTISNPYEYSSGFIFILHDYVININDCFAREGALNKCHPLKISRPDGTISTVCFCERRSKILEKIIKYNMLYEMRPSTYLFLPGLNIKRIRTPRRYSHAPPMDFISYLAEIILRHRELYWETRDKKDLPGIFESIINECVGVEGVPDLSVRIKLENCISKLYKEYTRAWSQIISNTLGFKDLNKDFIDKYVAYYIEPNDEYLDKLSSLWVMIEYSIFLRRFRILSVKNRLPFDSLIFDLQETLSKILGKLTNKDSDNKISIEWLIIQSCCYSGINIYPLMIWYATTFGTELPPSTIHAYSPSIKREYAASELPLPRWIPYTQVSLEEGYGVMDKATLERYARMLDIDSTLIAMAIDLFYGRFLSNPWLRGAIHTSFLKTILNIYDVNKQVIVIPAIYPLSYMHDRTKWVPTPIEIDILMTGKIRDMLLDKLQRLRNQHTSEQQWNDVARHVMRIVKEEALKIETNYSIRIRDSDIKDALEDSPCINGITIEVLHPLANYYLLDLIAKYNIAYIPGPTIGVNLIYFLMNRITGAHYHNVLFYLAVDANSFLEEAIGVIDYLNDVETRRQTHTSCVNKHNGILTCIKSYNLERLMKAVLAVEANKNNQRFECLSSISKVNRMLAELRS